jgi:hypothetical protein
MLNQLLGFGILELTKFTDADFTLALTPAYTIKLAEQDAEDEAKLDMAKEYDTLVRANGSKDVYTKPNKKSAIMTMNVVNPLAESLKLLVFPDAQKIIDGITPTKTKIEFYDQIGLLLSRWDNAVKAVFKPVDADENPLAAKYWMTFPRAVIVPALMGSASAKPGKTKLDIVSLGGLKSDGVTRVPLVVDGDETATP